MPQTFHLALLIHAHQPCGNFEHVLEKAYDDSYLPFLECLEEHPDVRLGLHYSGPLLTWIEKHRPEYFDRLRKLVQSGQVELVGGGFYEPILVSIPPEDQLEQNRRLARRAGLGASASQRSCRGQSRLHARGRHALSRRRVRARRTLWRLHRRRPRQESVALSRPE